MNELLEELTMNDIPKESRVLAENIGLEAFKKLVCIYSGTAKLYIPTIKSLTVAHRNNRIRQEYQEGKSVFQLARKWELSDRWIYSILEDADK